MQQPGKSIKQLIAEHKPGHALGRRFYTDPEIYALEIERIVMQNWIVAGHQSELPEPGDFKVLHVAGESAIIVRGKDHQLKAFANVCRHRGSVVCLETRGSAAKFTCPYHGWMYDLDGNLIAARNMPADFDKSQFSLVDVAVQTIHGLILVCFAADPPSTDDARREMAAPMDLFGFDNLKVAAFKEYAIVANWKLAIENYMECYHCATAHPDYAKMHTLMLDEVKRDRLQGHMLERMSACGMRDILVNGFGMAVRPGQMSYSYSRTALFEGYKTGSRDGAPVAPLLGELTDYDGGASDMVFGPFSYLLGYSDHVVCYVFVPIDMDHCRCDIYWLVRDDAKEGRDYDVDELTWLWDKTTEADKDIITNNGRGVRSRFYEPGPLSNMEASERNYLEWVLGQLDE
jgi:phenylpropionate dioxygenase-like ring-hydroxylating dioxygenase large terminal subunit